VRIHYTLDYILWTYCPSCDTIGKLYVEKGKVAREQGADQRRCGERGEKEMDTRGRGMKGEEK
jgi:hypothetical protein